MIRFLILSILAAALLAASTGCCSSDTGSREFNPGRGWDPVK